MRQALLSIIIYGLSTAIGIIAFLYPFWLPVIEKNPIMAMAHANDAPLMLTLLVGLCFMALLLEIQGESVSAKFVALLGVLVSINSVLRFVEAAIPVPGGFSPIFFLIVLSGYIYGGQFGFLMGALTLLASALITGTVGPWLPYQMFTAGWIGLSAPLCRLPVRAFRSQGRWGEVMLLAIFGGIWGLAFGLIMNIWFWPFAMGPAQQQWNPGITLPETVKRYAVFYLATSLLWDMLRAIGNIIITLTFGLPTLRVLRRFKHRFAFSYKAAL